MNEEIFRQLIDDRRREREGEARDARLAVEARRLRQSDAAPRIDSALLGHLLILRRQATQRPRTVG
jgi:hypothetical protein